MTKNDIQHKRNSALMTISINIMTIDGECCNVAIVIVMLSVVMLNIIMLVVAAKPILLCLMTFYSVSL